MTERFDAWSVTAGSNTTVDSINIAENMAPGNVNNAMRAIMASAALSFGGFPQGSARPSIVAAGSFWLDTTAATAPILKIYDGTDDITVITFDYSANTASATGFNIVDDTTPQLGGNLDLNGNVITSLVLGTDVQAFDATLTSLAAVAGVAGDILYASGTDAWARLAKGTDGEVLKLASGIPAWGASPTRFTAVATTSGTAQGFTGIAAGASVIAFMLKGVSLSAGDDHYIQLGDAGGYETSGYVSAAGDSGAETAGPTSAFIINRNSVDGSLWNGAVVFRRVDGNTWIMQGGMTAGGGNQNCAGSKTLTAELDRIQIISQTSDTFDAGSINILVQ